MQVAQILKVKGDMVFTLRPEESVAAAAALLHSRRVGALVVMSEGGQVAGIVSERDVVSVAATKGAQALDQAVSLCMTREVEFADPADSVDMLLARMTDRRIRHLPVCEGGRAGGHRLHRRPREVEDRRDPGRSRGPEGLHRRGLKATPELRARPLASSVSAL